MVAITFFLTQLSARLATVMGNASCKVPSSNVVLNIVCAVLAPMTDVRYILHRPTVADAVLLPDSSETMIPLSFTLCCPDRVSASTVTTMTQSLPCVV